MDKLEKSVRELLSVQGDLSNQESVYAGLLAEWERNHEDLLVGIAELREKQTALEEEIRAERLDIWAKDRTDKSKLYGIGIQERTELEYSEEKAFQWAVDHKLALKLDKRKFESIAKPTGSEESDIDFVLVRKVAIATIAGDLGKYLEDDNG